MSIYKSGAFIQQCFSVHPLCLTLQQFSRPDRIIVTCTSCRLAHRMTVRAMWTRARQTLASEGPGHADDRAVDYLTQCLSTHAMALRVREMDVINDWVGLRCSECRRLYDVDVAAFETQQR